MQPLVVAGCPVFIEGEGEQTLVMIHGWPDTHRVWAAQVAHFRSRYRCVTFSLPGFDKPDSGHSLEDVLTSIAAVVDTVSPNAPVILMIHDWGCVFGYEYAMRNPHRIARLVAVDIGDSGSDEFQRSLSLPSKLMLLSYQMMLASSWYVGGPIGNAVTRGLSRALQGKADPDHVHAGMNYPYAMRWLGALGGLKGLLPVEPTCPFFFAYARRKPFMFHSRQWAERMAGRADSRVQAFPCGHWVMVDEAQAFNQAIEAWLAAIA